MIKYNKPTEKDFNMINNDGYIINESNSNIFSFLNTNITYLKVTSKSQQLKLITNLSKVTLRFSQEQS